MSQKEEIDTLNRHYKKKLEHKDHIIMKLTKYIKNHIGINEDVSEILKKEPEKIKKIISTTKEIIKPITKETKKIPSKKGNKKYNSKTAKK
jgi:hypothetical protein